MVIPTTVKEALELRKGRIPIAGGTDLMVRDVEGEFLYLGRIEEMKGIKRKGEYFYIGACTTLSDIEENGDVPEVLKNAIKKMASPGIRNIATIGGNICNASPAGDTLPPLYVLNAELFLVSASDERRVPVYDFIKGPGLTDIKEDEILKEIIIPVQEFTQERFIKMGTRNALALSILSFAGVWRKEGGRLIDIRISLGAVAPTPLRSIEIEERLVKGYPWDEKFVKEILNAYDGLINPIDDQRSTAYYRRKISLKIIEEFLKEVNHGKNNL